MNQQNDEGQLDQAEILASWLTSCLDLSSQFNPINRKILLIALVWFGDAAFFSDENPPIEQQYEVVDHIASMWKTLIERRNSIPNGDTKCQTDGMV